LPSKRVLRYQNPRMIQESREIEYVDEDGEPRTLVKDDASPVYGSSPGIHVYGGLLTENVVQAVARDILADAVLRLERNRWQVSLHVHDEVVLHVSADKARACLEAAVTSLSTPPAWARGLVLAAEGGVWDAWIKE